MTYSFGILRTDKSDEADHHNAQWLGPTTLGIEVVLEPLAKQCGLGNVDPQHHVGGSSSAIERSMIHSLPPMGSKLVTIRLDKDAVGAMAVLVLRASGQERDIDPQLVARISMMDREGYNRHNRDQLDNINYERRETTDALNIIASRDDEWPDLASKVAAFIRILTREMPEDEIDRIAGRRTLGKVENWKIESYGSLGYIYASGEYREARQWGNREFLVAVVFDPHFSTPSTGEHPRYTIVRKPHCFDRRGFETRINAAESKARNMSIETMLTQKISWGGNDNIVSSPQGKGNETRLTKETILRIARECLESGVTS